MSSVQVDPRTQSDEEIKQLFQDELGASPEGSEELLEAVPSEEELNRLDRAHDDSLDRENIENPESFNFNRADSEDGVPTSSSRTVDRTSTNNTRRSDHKKTPSTEHKESEEQGNFESLDASDEEMAALEKKLQECQADNPPQLEITNKDELRKAKDDSGPKLVTSTNQAPQWEFKKNYPPTVTTAQLCRTFNVSNEETAHALKREVTKMTKFLPELSLRENKVNSILASLYDMPFDNQLETREAIQALIAESLGNELAKKGMVHEHPETQGYFFKWANKFMDQYTKKKDSLSNCQESQQTIRVERVNVQEDGQALVGNFQKDDEGGGGEDG